MKNETKKIINFQVQDIRIQNRCQKLLLQNQISRQIVHI
jgi:hypothetical protein